MNRPLFRFPCGDMGLDAGGGRNSDPPTMTGTGYWTDVDGTPELDATGPVRVTGRLGHGYALHTDITTPPGDPYNPNAGGVYAGDNRSIFENHGLENYNTGLDPEVDYFLPTGMVCRAYISIDRMPVVGDINYDGVFYPGAPIFEFMNQKVGIKSTGEVVLRDSQGHVASTGVFVGLDEFHMYELYVEFRHASEDRTTTVALRVDEEPPVHTCLTGMTYEYLEVNDSIDRIRTSFSSYSTGLTVDDIAFDAITSGAGKWIGPGECAIIRPVAEVDRPVDSWASGTDFSAENSSTVGSDPAHPQCWPGVDPNWYESLAFEIPYHPWNAAGDEGGIGGAGAAFAVGYVMSNPGGDPTGWDNLTFPVCRSSRRAPSPEEMIMELDDPGFVPTFSRPFAYAQRSRRQVEDTALDREWLIVYLESYAPHAGVLDFGNTFAAKWPFASQYLAGDPGVEDLGTIDPSDLHLVIRRETHRESIGVNVICFV
jgi:hypothetical protein